MKTRNILTLRKITSVATFCLIGSIPAISIAASQYSTNGYALLDKKTVVFKETDGAFEGFSVRYFRLLESFRSKYPADIVKFEVLGRHLVDDYRSYGGKSPEFRTNFDFLEREIKDDTKSPHDLVMALMDLFRASKYAVTESMKEVPQNEPPQVDTTIKDGPSVNVSSAQLTFIMDQSVLFEKALANELEEVEFNSMVKPIDDSIKLLRLLLKSEVVQPSKVGGVLLKLKSDLHLPDKKLRSMAASMGKGQFAGQLIAIRNQTEKEIDEVLNTAGAPAARTKPTAPAASSVAQSPAASVEAPTSQHQATSPSRGESHTVQTDQRAVSRLIEEGRALIQKISMFMDVDTKVALMGPLDKALNLSASYIKSTGLQSEQSRIELRRAVEILKLSHGKISEFIYRNVNNDSDLQDEFMDWSKKFLELE